MERVNEPVDQWGEGAWPLATCYHPLVPWSSDPVILTVFSVADTDMQFLASLVLVLCGLQVMPDAESLIVGESFCFNIINVHVYFLISILFKPSICF